MNPLKRYYAYTFFSNLFFERSIFLLYLLYKGFSIGEVAIFQAVTNLTMLLFEVVTGVIADKIGKKISLLCGAILIVVYHLMMLLANHYHEFLIAAFVFGLGYTFVSGTAQAYLYDLTSSDTSSNTLRSLGHFSAIATVSIGLAGYLGGYIQELNWNYLFLFGIVAQLISTAFLMTLPNVIKPHDKTPESKAIKNSMTFEVQTFVSLLKQDPFIRDISIYLTCNMGVVSALCIFSQELLQRNGFSISAISTFFLIDTMISAFVFAKVESTTKKFSVILALVISLALLFVSFGGIVFSILLPIALLCMSNTNNFMGTILENAFNLRLPDYARATANSILNAGSSLLMAVAFFSMNWLGDAYILVLGSLGALSVIPLFYVSIRYRKDFS